MKNLTPAALALSPFWAIEVTHGHQLWAQLQVIDAEAHEQDYLASAEGISGISRKGYTVRDGVAILVLGGVMTKSPTSFGGGTATSLLRKSIRDAVKDDAVKSVLMVVDSPGGSVAGTAELAADIRAARAKKPFDVFVEDCACSAAYWASCGARKITANATALIGSLGTLMVITDSKDAADAMGLKVLVISTAEMKGAGTPGTEITEEHQAEYQGIVNDLNSHFKAAVKTGRGFDGEALDSRFDARVHIAQKALELGLIDAIGTLDAAFADLVAEITADSGDDLEASATSLGGNPALEISGDATPLAPESTGPSLGAGTAQVPAVTGQGKSNMKNILVRALTAFKLPKMATAVTVATSEDPEAIAAVMAEQVEAEVQDRLSNDPLQMACKANGIISAQDLQKVLEMRSLGETALNKARGDAKAEAVRAFGSDLGPQISAQVDSLPYSAVTSLAASWKAQADATFGIGLNGEAPGRQTAPSATAVDVSEATTPQRPWDRLTESQKATAIKQGHTTEERQDAWALNYLGEVN